MEKNSRYISISVNRSIKLLLSVVLILSLVGCGKPDFSAITDLVGMAKEDSEESEDSTFVDVRKLSEENSEIFAWINIPDTDINYPILQSFDGDDDYYKSHNENQQSDPAGAIYIEAANLKNMCDFNTVIHGSSPADGSRFAGLSQFLDRSFFDQHQYIYIYMDGNVLIYYTFAAFTRENTRLLAQYDFSYASGCQAFLDEIYSGRSMNKIIRSGWENAVAPENFLITLTTAKEGADKQTVVVGCLVGDVAGRIDRFVDYSEPEELY